MRKLVRSAQRNMCTVCPVRHRLVSTIGCRTPEPVHALRDRLGPLLSFGLHEVKQDWLPLDTYSAICRLAQFPLWLRGGAGINWIVFRKFHTGSIGSAVLLKTAVRFPEVGANLNISDLCAGRRRKSVWITSVSGAANDGLARRKFYSDRMAISEFQVNFSEGTAGVNSLLFGSCFRRRKKVKLANAAGSGHDAMRNVAGPTKPGILGSDSTCVSGHWHK